MKNPIAYPITLEMDIISNNVRSIGVNLPSATMLVKIRIETPAKNVICEFNFSNHIHNKCPIMSIMGAKIRKK